MMLNKKLLIKLFSFSLLSRLLTVLGSFFLGFTLAKHFGAQGVGLFSIAQAVLLGLSIGARKGGDILLLKHSVLKKPSGYFLNYSLFSVVIKSVTKSGLFITAVMAGGTLILYNKTDFDSQLLVILGLALSVVPFSIGYVVSSFLKAAQKPGFACLYENGIVSLLTAIIINIIFYFDFNIELWHLSFTFLLASLITSSVGLLQCSRLGDLSSCVVNIGNYASERKDFFSIAAITYIQNTGIIYLSGVLLSTHQLGLFKTAERVALFIPFILVVANAVLPPRFSLLYKENKIEELESLAKFSSRLCSFLALPFAVTIIVYSGEILSYFGPEFYAAKGMLVALVIVQFFNVSVGSVGTLLNMSGNQNIMKSISLFCFLSSLISFILFYYILPDWALFSSLMVNVFFQNCLALYFVYKRLDVAILPFTRRLLG